MALTVRHSFVSDKPEDPDATLVGADSWNADHPVTGVLGPDQGGTGVALADPEADRLLFWDESVNQMAYLTVGDGLVITDTVLDVAVPTVTDHGAMAGLADDDHPQYLTEGRADVLYADIGHSHTFADHGALTGLADDDHPQYLTEGRADVRYANVTHTHPQVGGSREYNVYLGAGPPATGQLYIENTGGQNRTFRLSKTDIDGTVHNLGLMLPGDDIALTDDPDTPPITGFARYVMVSDIVDDTTHWTLFVIRTDTSGSTVVPDGTRVRFIPTLSAGGSQASVSKEYVDGQDALRVAKAGDTMTGALTWDLSANNHLSIFSNAGVNSIHSYNDGWAAGRPLHISASDLLLTGSCPRTDAAQGSNADSLTRKDYVDNGLGGKANTGGGNATGTWPISITGSAGSVTGAVTSPATTWNVGSTYASSMQVMGDASYAAGLSFHRGGAYAVNFGLDYDNVVRCGGWSDGASVFRMHLDTAGNFTARGNVAAYSDIRLKKDLERITAALDKVCELTGYTFTRIDTNERQTGLIAQDVQKVLPEAVGETIDDVLNISYGNMMGLVVEAMKELRDEIRQLRKDAGL